MHSLIEFYGLHLLRLRTFSGKEVSCSGCQRGHAYQRIPTDVYRSANYVARIALAATDGETLNALQSEQ